MDSEQKEYIKNKGLILGLVLICFPLLDFMFGLNMSLLNSFLLFKVLWVFIFTFLLVRWFKEYTSSYDVFAFKDSFKLLFVISLIGFGVLTAGKILIWNISSTDKYIDINEKRDLDEIYLLISMNDSLYANGKITAEKYDETRDGFPKIEDVKDNWNDLREKGLGITWFPQSLIYVLFLNSIYCAILALFLRKKEEFTKLE